MLISIKAIGDICPGDKYIPGLGVLGKSKDAGSDFPLRMAKELLQGADIVLGNFEGLLTARATEKNGTQLTFCGLPEFSRDMINAGIRVLNVANNHSLEHGSGIFLESLEILKATGIGVCGLRSDSNKYHSEPVILTVKGSRIGIIGYNWVGVDNFSEADKFIAQVHDSIVNYTWERDNFDKPNILEANSSVIRDIKTLRKEVDILILMTHWGFEYVTLPPYNLTIEARSFIDAGADMIIGGHPHVLQGMEIYKGKPVFYSLGNFIFDFREKLTRCSAILDITMENKSMSSFRFEPLFINNDFQPAKASSEESEYILSVIQRSSDALSSADKKSELDDDRIYRQQEEFYNGLKKTKIMNYLLASLTRPSLIIIIAKKVLIFSKILFMRLTGRRVRW
jgi:poly-gamma-glutamate capsule biosynthesis protein CapA/YwtB (metallophosphatase superfamily)